MAKLVLDTLRNRDAIGCAISSAIRRGARDVAIVSPYVSELPKFIDLEGASGLRIICNARSTACNPDTLMGLLSSGRVEIRSRADIHAKVYICDECAFVTSANATPNGLSVGNLDAAVLIESKRALRDLRFWFDALWNAGDTENLRNYTQDDWRRLKANWSLAPLGREAKPSLYDLLIQRTVPHNTLFTFWYEIDDVPRKANVGVNARQQGIHELPNNLDNWDYWIETHCATAETHADLEAILGRYYNYVAVNVKVDGWPCTRSYLSEAFCSKMLDRPIDYRFRGQELLLTLYRTDHIYPAFKIDKNALRLINETIKECVRANRERWVNYCASKEGAFAICSLDVLYDLLDGERGQ